MYRPVTIDTYIVMLKTTPGPKTIIIVDIDVASVMLSPEMVDDTIMTKITTYPIFDVLKIL